jgi:integrase
MNKRRTLAAIFSRLRKLKVIDENPVQYAPRLKEKSTLHKAYTKEQLREVLKVLAVSHPNLHLCAMLMYGCLLRPHQEIRNLFRKDINEDSTLITLGGNQNKSGSIRSVYIPVYVRELLIRDDVHLLEKDKNIFTKSREVLNESYFNTAWSRVKTRLCSSGLIEGDHTLYSFRHTAAINLYMKTKDIYKVQRSMGHSSMLVTLTYMRSLGLISNLQPDDVHDL